RTGANCFGVAEPTMAVLLAILKKVRERDAAIRAGEWREPHLTATFLGARRSDGYPGITIGLVGLGRIGTRVAQLLAPWRVRILGYDPYVPPSHFLPTAGQRSTIKRCCGNRTSCRSTSCSRGRRAICSAKPSSS